MFESTPAFTG